MAQPQTQEPTHSQPIEVVENTTTNENSINENEPAIYITEDDPTVIAAYRHQFPGRKIVILPPDNVAKGIDEDDDLPHVPRRAA